MVGVDYANKGSFQWISVIRLPDFVTKEDFDWAVREATAKKKQDFSKVEFFTYDEGLYLSDARKVAPEKLKTVIRHPIKVKG